MLIFSFISLFIGIHFAKLIIFLIIEFFYRILNVFVNTKYEPTIKMIVTFDASKSYTE